MVIMKSIKHVTAKMAYLIRPETPECRHQKCEALKLRIGASRALSGLFVLVSSTSQNLNYASC